jgi:hypothetical protein
MRDGNNAPYCELCIDILSGICTDEERLAFERHLPDCEACQAEMKDLQYIWEALPAQMEHMNPPEDLKQQVMNAALSADARQQQQELTLLQMYPNGKAHQSNRANRPGRRFAGWKPSARWSAAALILLLAASIGWNVEQQLTSGSSGPTSGPPSIEAALSVPAAQIKRLIPLLPQSGSAEDTARGVACIVDNGRSRQFVVYLFGAAPTSGDQAYQVWLIHNGARTSAGTLRVADGENGIGLMAMPINDEMPAFDQIGITLEPDDHGAQPRGQKMFGSVL